MLARFFLVLAFFVTTGFQVIEPVPGEVNPNANISWPPPIYVLHGEVSVRGTANVPGMTSYFLEFRRLNDDFSAMADDVPWSPASLPTQAAVLDAELGLWNTAIMAPDGPYELRLTVNLNSGAPVHARVSPLRVENNPPPFAITPTVIPLPTSIALPTVAGPQALPTLLPTPTAFNLTPEATARINANVRAGDSTAYEVIGALVENQTVPIVGRSPGSEGWWVIQLPNGRRGFVAPSVVIISGDTSNLPRIAPPATPTPIASPTPPLPDATLTNVSFDREIKEGESFQIPGDGAQQQPGAAAALLGGLQLHADEQILQHLCRWPERQLADHGLVRGQAE